MEDRTENIVAIAVVGSIILLAVIFWPRAEPEAPRVDAIRNDPYFGNPDARPLIVYCDYTSPGCEEFVTETLPALRERFRTTGEAHLVMRDFPQSTEAVLAAEASACAHEQERYWEYLPILVEEGVTLSGADAAGLNTTALQSCLESRRHTSEVHRDVAQARADYATVSPTIVAGTDRTTDPSLAAVERLLQPTAPQQTI